MIPVNEPLLIGNELKYVQECVNSGWISSAGKFINEFEIQWAKYCGMQYGVAVCNGTIALELAVKILDLPEDSEIILPSFTIISCARAIIKAGCIPVLVDCTKDTWCMDVKLIEQAITPRTKAIMPVHIYGHPVEMEPLNRLAGQYDLIIIEDAAEAHGAEYQGKKCGGFGDVSCFSFYANKTITTGEGGMVLTNDAGYTEMLRYYRDLCFKPEQRFSHDEIGHNFRFTNLQAAVGLAQLEQIERFVERKREIAAKYNQGLQGLPLQLPIEKSWAKNSYWMYGVLVDHDSGFDSKKLAACLADRGIQTRPFFKGMHQQPALKKMGLFEHMSLPVTEMISRQGLYLPSGQATTNEQVSTVINILKQIFAA